MSAVPAASTLTSETPITGPGGENLYYGQLLERLGITVHMDKRTTEVRTSALQTAITINANDFV